MLDFLLAGGLSLFLIMLVDDTWMGNLKKAAKYEKGLKFIEHYHWGLVLITISILVQSLNEVLAVGLAVAGFTFIILELKQKNKFALTSSHAKLTTVIGVVLTVIATTTYFLIQ